MGLNKTKIEWADYTINPIKGLCKYACSYCYARRMYKRFKWDTEIKLDLSAFDGLIKLPLNSRVFVCSTHDIMGEWIPDKWIQNIIDICSILPQANFMFLSKNSNRYGDFKFPPNIWLGQTIIQNYGHVYLPIIQNKCFLSFEPLLGKVSESCLFYDWVIVGGLSPKPVHKKEWVDDIINKCRKQNIPIFLKDNLHYPDVIKEFPRGQQCQG